MGTRLFALIPWFCVPLMLQAQQPVELKEVLDRLDRLEAQNQALMTEIRALRQQLAASPLTASPPRKLYPQPPNPPPTTPN